MVFGELIGDLGDRETTTSFCYIFNKDGTLAANKNQRKRTLAVASAGGHWHQLQLVLGSCDQREIHYLTTLDGLPREAGLDNWTIVHDCNRNRIPQALLSFVQIGFVVFQVRPKFVITTGAFPGLLAIVWGRVLGCSTIWIDSVANAESLSESGKLAKRLADICLTQWPHVAADEQIQYEGSVL